MAPITCLDVSSQRQRGENDRFAIEFIFKTHGIPLGLNGQELEEKRQRK